MGAGREQTCQLRSMWISQPEIVLRSVASGFKTSAQKLHLTPLRILSSCDVKAWRNSMDLKRNRHVTFRIWLCHAT